MQNADTQKTIKLWQDALHSYDSALKLHDTPDARHNYDYVKEKLEQLKKQQQQQQKNQKDQSGSGSQSQDQSSQNSQSGQGNQNNGRPQDQSGQNNPQNGGQNQSQSSQQQGDQQGNQSGQQPSSGSKNDGTLRTYSGTRAQDQTDPGIKSKQDAENLLDSLKDDEKRITARSLNGDNPQPPPASGKDW
jgi:Ca-activated chloride channel family protein